MGFFSSVCRAVSSGISAVTNTVKKVATAVVDTGKKVVKAVAEKTSNMWNKFTGKDKFEEAKKLYEEITVRYTKEKKKYDKESGEYINSIEKNINKINCYKGEIFKGLLPEMIEKLSKIKDVEIPTEFTLEEYKKNGFKTHNVRSREKLFIIDFDKEKFKTYTQAIFTLGFFTRKKSKETLLQVKDEECRVNEEIEKMKAELNKLQGVNEAILNAVEYFESMVDIYKRLLTRVDNSMNTLYMKAMLFTHKLVSDSFTLKMLPMASVKEIQAIITASKVLRKIGQTNFTNMEEKKAKEFMKKAKDSKVKLEETLNAA